MTNILQSIQSGTRRGLKLASNPTVEEYRTIKKPRRTTPLDPWAAVGEAISQSMLRVKLWVLFERFIN